jgi:hypothetical protein
MNLPCAPIYKRYSRIFAGFFVNSLMAVMSAYLLINHLLNFMAPAALLALLMVVLPPLFFGFFRSKRPSVRSWWVQVAINFVVGVLVLAAGLVLLGRDGKMLTYVGLVLATATSQWLQMGCWKK